MAITTLQTLNAIEVMENFLDRNRPPKSMRRQFDISYRIEEQSIVIYEIISSGEPRISSESPVAKATYVKSRDHWKVFWPLASGKWHSYPVFPVVQSLEHFIQLVEKDEYGCFWG